MSRLVSYHFHRRLLRFSSSYPIVSPNVHHDNPDVKPKPKATTSLRRTAAASLPIRANPTPTRGAIQAIVTLATAERYALQRLRTRPVLPVTAQMLHEAWWVPRWDHDGRSGEVFVFGNGALVCWGIGVEGARTFARDVLGSRLGGDRDAGGSSKNVAVGGGRGVEGLEVEVLKEVEMEELEFVVDPLEDTRLQGDLIILGRTAPLTSPILVPNPLPLMALPHETLLARYAYSQALSRSTALSGLETALDDYLTSMARMPHALAQTGRPGMGRGQLIRKLGELMKFRQGLNLNRENFSDVPDFYWAEPVLERYFKSLSDALEVTARTASVNDKITYAAELQSLLRQLLTESSSHSMELVIIALIAVEVVIALIRDGPELWHMVVGNKEHEETRSII